MRKKILGYMGAIALFSLMVGCGEHSGADDDWPHLPVVKLNASKIPLFGSYDVEKQLAFDRPAHRWS